MSSDEPSSNLKPRTGPAQLAAVLAHERIDAVIDVGANVGQYRRMLRQAGYAGSILSFEPLPGPREQLALAAAADPLWQLAPPMALGDAAGQVILERSAESDMSSVLAQTPLLQRLSPSSAVLERLEVPCARLDALGHLLDATWRRLHLKVDVQGYEPRVLEGARGLMPRIRTIQLELALRPVYQGELDWRCMVDRMAEMGFEPALMLPGYFERKIARMLQIDVVFSRIGTGSG